MNRYSQVASDLQHIREHGIEISFGISTNNSVGILSTKKYFFVNETINEHIIQTTGLSGRAEVTWTPEIKLWYCISLLMKIIMEIVFVYFNYVLQVHQSQKVSEEWSIK